MSGNNPLAISASAAISLELRLLAIGEAWQALSPDHPIYAKVGRVASGWSHIEHLLDQTIWRLAGTEPRLGACVSAQMMGLNNRVEALRALLVAKNFDQKAIDKLNSFQSGNHSPQERRNRIIHDPWFEEKHSKKTGQFKAMPKKQLTYGIKPVTEEYVDDTLKIIAERMTEATNLVNLIISLET